MKGLSAKIAACSKHFIKGRFEKKNMQQIEGYGILEVKLIEAII